MATTIWLNVSLSNSLSKKKKLKITILNDNYGDAFRNLCKTVNEKLLKLDSSAEISKPEMVYKPETDLDGDENTLEDFRDLEGMLEEYPGGGGVRVIVAINDVGGFDVRSSSVGSLSTTGTATRQPAARSVSLNMRSIYESLREAARKPGPEESSYFVNPFTNQIEDIRLVDFRVEEDSVRGENSSYGQVFEATYNDIRYAIKKIEGLVMDSTCDRPAIAFEREMTFLRKTTDWKCDNIVKFHGFIRTDTTARIILELMDKDLSQVIKSLKASDFFNRMNEGAKDLEEIGYIILRDISNGLRYIHGYNSKKETFMHRDVKPSNIMVKCQEYRFALIDFGTTKQITVEANQIHSTGAGQPYYEAPECLEYKPEYNESCDIWSLGITMIKFITGKHPVWDEDSEESSSSEEHIINNKICCRIMGKTFNDEKYDWPIRLTSDFLSKNFKDLINACVNRDPKRRPTAQKIYEIAKKRSDSIDPLRVQQLFGNFFES